MSKVIKLNAAIMKIDFDQIARREANPKARVRAIILSNIISGKNKTDAAGAVGMDRTTALEIIKRVNKSGLKGLYDKVRCGRPPRLTIEKKEKFCAAFLDAQKKKDGGRLTGYDAQEILKNMGVDLRLSRVYDVLHQCGLSWVSSRSAHPMRNEAAQAAFKKTSSKKLLTFCHRK